MQAVGINIEKLEKSFFTIRGKVTALKSINLNINPGEFFVLLGPSGCGKSTLLNLIAGLEKPSSGRLVFGDREVANPDKNIFLAPFERDIAMVFQSYALYPHMTIEENIAFPCSNMKENPSKEEIKNKIQGIAKLLQITHLLDRKPAELSGGQRQRVAIGRAIIRNPQIFLMDEPLSNLDAQLRMDMRAQLKALQQKLGVTTIYVTHDQLEAMTLGDRIAILHDGYIQQVGTPIDVYNNPVNEFIARFIGSPSMNLFKGEIIEESEKSYLQAEGLKILIPLQIAAQLKKKGKNSVTIGVRPENFEILPAGKGNMDVKIDVIENIGSEYLLYVFLSAGQIVIKTTVKLESKDISLKFIPQKIHLFDETGNRIIDD